MTAALKSYVPRPVPSRAKATGSVTVRSAYSPALWHRRTAATGQLQALPVATQPSPLLINLKRLHLVSSVLTTALVGLTLISYGVSVYVDRQLSQATQQLRQLQRSEQQLTTANAILTSHMAKQAELPTTGLQPPRPDGVIFLKPAPLRSPEAATTTEAPQGFALTPPLGY